MKDMDDDFYCNCNEFPKHAFHYGNCKITLQNDTSYIAFCIRVRRALTLQLSVIYILGAVYELKLI